MITSIRCGFQSGADIGAARAAKNAGIPTSGWLPFGFKTENGPRPEYAELYGAREHPSPDYPPRTAQNVQDADLTIWFGFGTSPGFWSTHNAAKRHLKPFWDIGMPGRNAQSAERIAWNIILLDYHVINVSGNRESSNPGIGAAVEQYLTEVFRILVTQEESDDGARLA